MREENGCQEKESKPVEKQAETKTTETLVQEAVAMLSAAIQGGTLPKQEIVILQQPKQEQTQEAKAVKAGAAAAAATTRLRTPAQGPHRSATSRATRIPPSLRRA